MRQRAYFASKCVSFTTERGLLFLHIFKKKKKIPNYNTKWNEKKTKNILNNLISNSPLDNLIQNNYQNLLVFPGPCLP